MFYNSLSGVAAGFVLRILDRSLVLIQGVLSVDAALYCYLTLTASEEFRPTSRPLGEEPR